MRRYSLVVVCGAMLVGSGIGIASAADMPPPFEPPPVMYAPVPQIFSWSGFYVGGNAGWGWTNTSGTFTTATGTGSFSGSGNGFLGGAQAGYNWQTGPFVVGAELDFQELRRVGRSTRRPVRRSPARQKRRGSARCGGRVGYVADRVLLYATGGGVYGDTSLSGTVPGIGSFSNSTTFWTWTAGAGVEWAFYGCWSAKLEYLYVGSPSKFPAVPTVTAIVEDNSSNTNIVRAGINYHF